MLQAGCVFRTVREQQARADAVGEISGTVVPARPGAHVLVVVLLRRDTAGTSIADHFVLERPGRWIFRATPGTYGLAAFEDVNGDLRYDPGEPALYPSSGDFFDLAAGEKRSLPLVIPRDGRAPVDAPVDIAALQARGSSDQLHATLGELTVLGEVVDLRDPRFDEDVGRRSMWAPVDFLFEVNPGVYFAEPYDPKKIPVLFVHGITGTPRNFAAIVGRLDRSRLQPWFFYYPSGARLETVVDVLENAVAQLRVRYGFRELYVVAHSMGGLIARAAVLDRGATRFVTIATPWGGNEAAQAGVEHAPAVVHAWSALAPGSAFLDALFYEQGGGERRRRRLPATVR